MHFGSHEQIWDKTPRTHCERDALPPELLPINATSSSACETLSKARRVGLYGFFLRYERMPSAVAARKNSSRLQNPASRIASSIARSSSFVYSTVSRTASSGGGTIFGS